MECLADLHIHTTASDGQYTPTELVQLAKQRGIQVLAVTDHDTIDGVNEAQRAGDALGLPVIRGVELSAPGAPQLPHPGLRLPGRGHGALPALRKAPGRPGRPKV